MVLCLKSAEALLAMIAPGAGQVVDWFPKSFLITEERLNRGLFKGRRDLAAKL